MNAKNARKFSYRSMLILAVIVGVAGILLQFIPGFEFFTFFLTVPTIGGLVGGKNGYEEPDHARRERSFQAVLEGLLLILMLAFGFIELPKLLPGLQAAVNGVNGHWPGLMLSILCILIGTAGFLKMRGEARN
jgi:hypothetical protein